MKTRLITTAILLMGINLLYAQNSPKQGKNEQQQLPSKADTTKKKCALTVINYNFKTKMPCKIPYCKSNQPVCYRINNINRLLYDVKISTSQTEYHSEPPAGVAQMFNTAKTETSSKETDQSQVTKDALSAIKAGASISNETDMFADEYETQSYNLEKLKSVGATNDSIKNINDSIQKISNKISLQLPRVKLYLQIKSSLSKTYRYFNQLERLIQINNDLVAFSLRDIDYSSASKKVDHIQEVFPYTKRPEQLLSNFLNSYNDFKKKTVQYIEYLNTDKSLRTSDKILINNNLKSLSDEVEQLKTTVDNEKYNEVIASLNCVLFELKKESNFFVVSDPVQAEKDVVNFEINITPRNNAGSSSNLDNRKFTASVPVVGGFKFDFSTGLFLTSGLYDRQYNTTVSSDSSIITRNKNHNIANISLGALLHISKRSKCDYKLGGSIGVGLSSNDLSKLNVFIGPCCIIGKKEQLIVSLGMAFAQVDYLKGKYSVGTKYKTSELDQTLTEKVTRIGGFISFTYNFTSQKKE